MLDFLLPLSLLLFLWYLEFSKRWGRKREAAASAADDTSEAKRPWRSGQSPDPGGHCKDTPVLQVNKIKRVNCLFIGTSVSTCGNLPNTGIKIDWSSEHPVTDRPSPDGLQHLYSRLTKERSMNEELTDIIKKLHHRLEAMDERDQKARSEREQISSMIDTLQNSLKTGEERFEAMRDRYKTRTKSMSEQFEKERREEHCKVSTFVLKLDQRDKQLSEDVVGKMEDGQLRDVAKELIEDYNVRLLAIDCGLSFMMDVPESQWATVEKRQNEIGEVLKKLLPSDIRPVVNWKIPIPVSEQTKRQIFPSGPSGYAHHNGDGDESSELKNGGFERDRAEFTSGATKYTSIRSTEAQSPQSSERQSEERTRISERACKETPKGRLKSDPCAEQEQVEEQPDKMTHQYERVKSPRDVKIHHLESKIKELEAELEQEKRKSAERSGCGLRKEQDRHITMSLRFRSSRPHRDSFSDVFASTNSAHLANVTRQLADTFHVKLQGVFCGYDSEDSDVHRAFVLQTSMAERQNVTDRQEDIQRALSELLTEPDVVWSNITLGLVPQPNR